jgi:hypothetical protein
MGLVISGELSQARWLRPGRLGAARPMPANAARSTLRVPGGGAAWSPYSAKNALDTITHRRCRRPALAPLAESPPRPSRDAPPRRHRADVPRSPLARHAKMGTPEIHSPSMLPWELDIGRRTRPRARSTKTDEPSRSRSFVRQEKSHRQAAARRHAEAAAGPAPEALCRGHTRPGGAPAHAASAIHPSPAETVGSRY